MRKLICFINITLDGFCDHTAMIADDDLHETVNELFKTADTILFGRNTYQLMETAWPPMVLHPTGNKPMDEFAVLMDDIHKVVFSHTLKTVTWKNTELATKDVYETVMQLKQQPGKNILVGSPGLIASLTQLDLIDEYQLCVHPVILGKGLVLFKNIASRIDLTLLKIKQLSSGAVVHYYEPGVRQNKD